MAKKRPPKEAEIEIEEDFDASTEAEDDFDDLDDLDEDLIAGGEGDFTGYDEEPDFDEDEDLEPAAPDEDEDEDRPRNWRRGASGAKRSRRSSASAVAQAKLIAGVLSRQELSSVQGQQKAWQKLMNGIEEDRALVYDINATVKVNDIIRHPRFGLGFVCELISPTKAEVLFEDQLRKLVINRSGGRAPSA